MQIAPYPGANCTQFRDDVEEMVVEEMVVEEMVVEEMVVEEMVVEEMGKAMGEQSESSATGDRATSDLVTQGPPGPQSAVEATLEEVAREAGEDSGVDPSRLGSFLSEVLRLASSGDRLSSSQRERLQWEGDRAAREGVALPGLLDLYLSALWRVFAAHGLLGDERPASNSDFLTIGSSEPPSLRDFSMTLLRAGDDAAAALAEGFSAAQQRSLQFDAAGRRELFEDLLAGAHDPHLLAERAGKFGFNLAAPHHVLVAQTHRNQFDRGPLPATIESLLISELGVADALLSTKAGRLVLVLPGSLSKIDFRLSETIVTESKPEEAIVGAGTTQIGVLGIRQSYEEAIEAVEIASIQGISTQPVDSSPGRLVRFSALLPQRLLRSNPVLSAELVDSVLGPLNAARNSGDHLLETLGALTTTRGNVSAAARELHVSPRAVSYRVQRIAELTGYSPLEAEGAFVLELARRCSILERPAHRLEDLWEGASAE